MQLSSGYENRKGRVDIVPLMDVMFLLLVFFIYAMVRMTMERGVKVALPAGPGKEVAGKSMVISITASNTLAMENRVLTLDQLLPEAAALTRLNPGLPVLIKGDRTADLGVAVELVARLRHQGITQVSFLVDPDKGP
jgi:biopolymer transport protein ExbD